MDIHPRERFGRSVPLICECIVLVVLAGVCPAQAVRAERQWLEIVTNGKPRATVVIPQDANLWTRKAASWLTEYVRKSTGAELQIVTDRNVPSGNIISIGSTRLANQAGIGTDGLKWNGCKLIAKGRILYLLGKDDVPRGDGYDFEGLGAQGSCKAVVTFLEDFLDTRWFIPSPEGELIVTHKDVRVPRTLHNVVVPAFAYVYGRDIYTRGTPGWFANNYSRSVKLQSFGGHSYYKWLPAEKYFDDHPEYFALIDGRRVGGNRTERANHLCSTNPEVGNILLREIRRWFDMGYDWVELGQEDSFRRCQCSRCERMDSFREDMLPPGGAFADFPAKSLKNNPCERLLMLHQWIAEQCRKSHPDKTVQMLVYQATLWPSKRVVRFGDNVVANLTNHDYRIVEAWKDKVKALTAYLCWFDPTLNMGMGVNLTPAEAAEKLRFFRKNNIIGIYLGGGGNWGLQGPTYYVLGKLLGNPDLDQRVILREYCRGVYGRAGDIMCYFFEVLYSRSFPKTGGYLDLASRLAMTNEDRYLYLYPPEILEQCEHLLAKAERTDVKPSARNWLRMTRDHFDYIRDVTAMFVSYRAYRSRPSRENLEQLRSSVTVFEEFRSRILSYDRAYTKRWFPGHGEFCNFLTSGGDASLYYSSWAKRKPKFVKQGAHGLAIGFHRSAIREPITLDFDKMFESAGGREQAVLLVRQALKPPTIDGIPGRREWAGSEAQAMRPLSGASSSVEATIRAMYDDRQLYIAYECREPEIENLRTRKTGRDGNVWDLDCVDMFLSPTDSTVRYQFMVAPAEEAYYDARLGLTGEDRDCQWNPRWRYGFQIDASNKRWCIEMAIPFDQLGRKGPRPGTGWRGNFCRVRRARGNEELFMWSPSRSGSFADPSAFGELRFVGAQSGAGTSGLIPNGGFEGLERKGGGKPVSWRLKVHPENKELTAAVLRGVGVTTERSHEGRRSLKIDVMTMDADKLDACRQAEVICEQDISRVVSRLRGRVVRFSAWVYFDSIADKGPAFHPGPVFAIYVRGKHNQTITDKTMVVRVDPSLLKSLGYVAHAARLSKWIKVEKEWLVPAEAQGLEVVMSMSGKADHQINTTCVYIDDVMLVPQESCTGSD